MVLESPEDVMMASPVPGLPYTVVAGTESGLLIGWNLSNFQHVLCGNVKNPEFEVPLHVSEAEEMNIPSVRWTCHSSAADGHTGSIYDLVWLVASEADDDTSDHRKILTSVSDGMVMAWDAKDVIRCFRETSVSSFGDWKPVNKARIVTGPLEKCIRITCAKLVLEKSSLLPQIKIFCGTEEGDVLFGKWDPHAIDQQRSNLQMASLGKAHYGSVVGISFSSLVEGVFVSFGEWDVAIWHTKNKGPTFRSSYTGFSPTAAFWSLERASILYVGRTDGNLEVWDLTVNTHQPLSVHPISRHALTFIASCGLNGALFVGDEDGTVSMLSPADTLRQGKETEMEDVNSSMECEIARHSKRKQLPREMLAIENKVEPTKMSKALPTREELLKLILQMENEILETFDLK